jgi:hypothetical protein
MEEGLNWNSAKQEGAHAYSTIYAADRSGRNFPECKIPPPLESGNPGRN